ncbi:PilZ domain-containing protein [Methylomonas paludis]|uniref:PilZ domain-containing protein n=1 Tax=Methylomonas paludis TaxID=1173101 RepID=A0A975MQB0_9GAMM|nr:PilZ domain-containing protein [Methylomonas paludis]QWF72068.1 PilZ domain-containing protein [Methylomonas paludis]
MLNHDEKRDFARMEIQCELKYRLADSPEQHIGRCKTLSAAGISFNADHFVESGLAMEVSIRQCLTAPELTAFIEVVRCVKQPSDDFVIAAVIRSIKGN